jgi:plastocyanin domain-containing protein
MSALDLPAAAMTLRDYFAAKAMPGAVTLVELSPDDIAEYAYAIADAMLRARDRAPTSWPRLHSNTDFLKG